MWNWRKREREKRKDCSRGGTGDGGERDEGKRDKERTREGEVEEGHREWREGGEAEWTVKGDNLRTVESLGNFFDGVEESNWRSVECGEGGEGRRRGCGGQLLVSGALPRCCNWVVAAVTRVAPLGYESMVTY